MGLLRELRIIHGDNMEKIPTPPYLEYSKKYKVMSVNELEKAKYELGTKLRHAEEKWANLRERGDGDEEYRAWLEVRFMTAELDVLESVLRLQSLFDNFNRS